MERVKSKVTILLGIKLLINKFSENSYTTLSSDC